MWALFLFQNLKSLKKMDWAPLKEEEAGIIAYEN